MPSGARLLDGRLPLPSGLPHKLGEVYPFFGHQHGVLGFAGGLHRGLPQSALTEALRYPQGAQTHPLKDTHLSAPLGPNHRSIGLFDPGDFPLHYRTLQRLKLAYLREGACYAN